jgi:flagellin
MPSVSNIAIGANMAAAAATKARHGMNESIARLSTGVRAMYGADAAGHSVGTLTTAHAKSYAAAARNIEDGISYAQTGEAVLLEVASLAQRLFEIGIAEDNTALLSTEQIAALDAEGVLIADTIANVLTNTKFNGVDVVSNGASKSVTIAYGNLTANVTEVGPGQAVTDVSGNTASTAHDTSAGTLLGTVAYALGNIAADLTALKAYQGAAASTSANLSASAARLLDTDFAVETASLTKNAIMNQAALAMAAQANQAQSAILAVLQ